MANIYIIKTAVNPKETKVVANSSEEAQTKVALAEGEAVVSISDAGEVTV